MASRKPPKNKDKKNYKKSRRDNVKPNQKGYSHYVPDIDLPTRKDNKKQYEER